MGAEFVPVHWHWWALAALLMMIELLAPGLFFIWVAVSALLTGGLLWLIPTFSLAVQWGLFSLLAIFSIVVARHYLQAHKTLSDQPGLNRRMARHLGTVLVLKEPIMAGKGRIRLDGSIWTVIGEDCPAGTPVRITATEGIGLRVAIEPKARGK